MMKIASELDIGEATLPRKRKDPGIMTVDMLKQFPSTPKDHYLF